MRVMAVFRKELMDTLKNKMLVFGLVPVPLIFLVISLAFIYFTSNQPPDPREVENYLKLSPEFASIPPGEVLQIMVMGQFMFMFLMIPVFVPMTIATFSIIGEKQARSLEPLLATPVRTWELLLGKSLAATVPAVAITWITYGLLLIGMVIMAPPRVLAEAASGMWLLAMAVIVPLLAVLAVNVGVLISSRANDTRVAQQIGGMVVLPFVGMGIAQTAGLIMYSLPMFVAGAMVLALIDWGVLVAAVRLFHRETILTRWK